jgi:hypothetical protein
MSSGRTCQDEVLVSCGKADSSGLHPVDMTRPDQRDGRAISQLSPRWGDYTIQPRQIVRQQVLTGAQRQVGQVRTGRADAEWPSPVPRSS